MRQLFAVTLAAAALAVPARSAAQVGVGPTLAFHDDFDVGVGATVDVPVPSLHPDVGVLADVIYFFPGEDNLDYWEINGNLTWEFPDEELPVVPFALGGLNLAHVSVDRIGRRDTSDTEVGLNLGGGLEFGAGGFRPRIGGRFELDGGEGFVLFGTLPFNVGG